MTNLNIASQRLHNQKLAGIRFENPADVVAWFGAVQAQDYLGALWAVGLRTKNAFERDIEQAIAERQIVRTWPMRGTLHFVAATDVRWMLKLLTPRVIASSTLQRLYKQAGLDEAAFTRSKKIFANSLQGGKTLTRNAMYEVLEAKGISTQGQRGLHILSRLAQDGFICFALREGKQQTFALLDEWIQPAKILEGDEALAELARRYFTSHGPATLQDFAWWSGLTIGDAKSGIEMAKSHLSHELIDKKAYWFSSSVEVAETPPTAYLLPAYDEYTVAYIASCE